MMTISTMMTNSTMMTISTILTLRKFEVVQKQAVCYMRKLEVVHEQVGGFWSHITPNLLVKRSWRLSDQMCVLRALPCRSLWMMNSEWMNEWMNFHIFFNPSPICTAFGVQLYIKQLALCQGINNQWRIIWGRNHSIFWGGEGMGCGWWSNNPIYLYPLPKSY